MSARKVIFGLVGIVAAIVFWFLWRGMTSQPMDYIH